MMDLYILNGDTPVLVDDVIEWGRWFDENRAARVVAKNSFGDGAVEVSTVFLGIDHGWGRGRPVLYETMIFGGSHDQWQQRYCTKEEAEEGHQEAVTLLKMERDNALSDWYDETAGH